MTGAPLEVTTVSLDLALDLLAGARAAAAEQGVAVGMAVVDIGGNVVASCRMDGAQLVAMSLATDKAWTAVACGAPTDQWAESSAPGGPDWGLSTSLGGRLIVFAGGLPIRSGGTLIGGIGVSGAASSVDRACGEAALRAAGLDA
jgi:uncharacterized protein GlcG (DUF336 family)